MEQSAEAGVLRTVMPPRQQKRRRPLVVKAQMELVLEQFNRKLQVDSVLFELPENWFVNLNRAFPNDNALVEIKLLLYQIVPFGFELRNFKYLSGSTLRIRFIRSRAYWLMNFGMSNCSDRIFL